MCVYRLRLHSTIVETEKTKLFVLQNCEHCILFLLTTKICGYLYILVSKVFFKPYPIWFELPDAAKLKVQAAHVGGPQPTIV